MAPGATVLAVANPPSEAHGPCDFAGLHCEACGCHTRSRSIFTRQLVLTLGPEPAFQALGLCLCSVLICIVLPSFDAFRIIYPLIEVLLAHPPSEALLGPE